jgi:hypothetical protein
LPSDVTLTKLTGSVSPDAGTAGGGASGGDLRGSIAGPALEITGCAQGQDTVADFVSALQDIDGVTRVGLSSSQIGDSSSGGGTSSASSGSGGSGECPANTASFSITVAFDSVPTPPSATAAPSVPPSLSSSTASTTPGQPQLTDAQNPESVSQTSAKQQVGKGHRAVHNFLGGGG